MPIYTQIELTIKALLKHVPALREAGVLSLSIDGLTATLAPFVVEHEVDADAATTTEPPTNPWNDPDTYGRTAGAKVPGITKEK